MGTIPPTHCPHCGACLGCSPYPQPWYPPYPYYPQPYPAYPWPYWYKQNDNKITVTNVFVEPLDPSVIDFPQADETINS